MNTNIMSSKYKRVGLGLDRVIKVEDFKKAIENIMYVEARIRCFYDKYSLQNNRNINTLGDLIKCFNKDGFDMELPILDKLVRIRNDIYHSSRRKSLKLEDLEELIGIKKKLGDLLNSIIDALDPPNNNIGYICMISMYSDLMSKIQVLKIYSSTTKNQLEKIKIQNSIIKLPGHKNLKYLKHLNNNPLSEQLITSSFCSLNLIKINFDLGKIGKSLINGETSFYETCLQLFELITSNNVYSEDISTLYSLYSSKEINF